jgi:hypothetical protein
MRVKADVSSSGNIKDGMFIYKLKDGTEIYFDRLLGFGPPKDNAYIYPGSQNVSDSLGSVIPHFLNYFSNNILQKPKSDLISSLDIFSNFKYIDSTFQIFENLPPTSE